MNEQKTYRVTCPACGYVDHMQDGLDVGLEGCTVICRSKECEHQYVTTAKGVSPTMEDTTVRLVTFEGPCDVCGDVLTYEYDPARGMIDYNVLDDGRMMTWIRHMNSPHEEVAADCNRYFSKVYEMVPKTLTEKLAEAVEPVLEHLPQIGVASGVLTREMMNDFLAKVQSTDYAPMCWDSEIKNYRHVISPRAYERGEGWTMCAQCFNPVWMGPGPITETEITEQSTAYFVVDSQGQEYRVGRWVDGEYINGTLGDAMHEIKMLDEPGSHVLIKFHLRFSKPIEPIVIKFVDRIE